MTSPMEKWLAYNPGKTPEDWGKLIKKTWAAGELAKLDGFSYMNDDERRRRAAERQRLCRRRAKERQERLEAENGKLRELVRDMYGAFWAEFPSAMDGMIGDRIRELGIEVDE